MRKQIEPLAKPYPKTDKDWHKIDRSQFKHDEPEPENENTNENEQNDND